MGKRRSPILAKVSNLIKVSIFIAKMKLVYLKKSTKKLSNFRSLKHYHSYHWLQEYQFSPSTTPLIRFHNRPKTNRSSFVYSVCFLSCFGGREIVMVDNENNYSLESARAIAEVERDGSEVSYSYGYGEQEEEEEEDDSVDERAEKFIQTFYEEMKRQRRESSSSSSYSYADLPLNRLLEY